MNLVIGTAGWRTSYGALKKQIINKEKIEEILHLADSKNFLAIDTSPDYGDAEMMIGQCFWKRDIATKIVFNNESEKDLQIKLRHSIERLRVNHLSVVFIHNWDDLNQTNKLRALKFMNKMKAIGLVRDIGISTYSVSAIKHVLASRIQNIIIQVNLNILDQRVAEIGVEAWQDKMLENRIKLWGRSIFLQGILLDSSKENPFLNHPDLIRFWQYCLSIGRNSYDVCLAYPRQLGFIDAIVIGINDANEIQDLVDSNHLLSTQPDFSSLASSDLNLIDPRRWK